MKKLLSILFLVLSVVAFGQLPEKPNPQKLVNDYSNTLSASQVADLEARLVAFDNQTSNQVVVVLVNSTNGVEIAEYATELGRKWGVGGKANNNGVMFVIAVKDRKLNISTGYGLEGALTDALSQTIIDNEVVPSFKSNDYYGGISKGAEAIMKATQGAYKAPEGYNKRKRGSGGGSSLIFIVILIVVFIFLSRGGGGRGGGMMSRRGYRGIGGFPIIFPTGGGGGGGWSGGGGSSGGGGFGGFGGGSFGGGGASGSW